MFRTANAAENPELFWGLKGGGPNAFAVVLSATFKTWQDTIASGASLYINETHTTNKTLWWEGIRIFHSYSNHFVDNGLYVYYEIHTTALHVRPFVAHGKTAAQLDAILAPMKAELIAHGVPFELTTTKQYPGFYPLYIDLFEDEGAGAYGLTGGWMFNHQDVATNNDGIIRSFKTIIDPRPDLTGVGTFMAGHMFNVGNGLPISNSATHPAWRNGSDLVVTILPVPAGATLAQKADLQNVLTTIMDASMQRESVSGVAYVNEVSPLPFHSVHANHVEEPMLTPS